MNKLYYYFKKFCILSFKITGFNKVLRKYSDYYETKNNPAKLTNKVITPGWSIIVITDGNNNDCLSKLIESATKEFSNTPYEIIIVGPKNLNVELFIHDKNITHLPYHELLLWGVPGFISRKKNLGANIAKYDKLVICHDYIVFLPGWKKGFDTMENFNVCINIMLNKDGTRHRDWMTFDYPGVGQALLPYKYECNKYQYVNGAYFVVKRDFFIKNPIDENLRWGEGEDVEWSIRIREKTKLLLNEKSMISYSKQKPAISMRWVENSKKLSLILEKNNE